MGLKAAALAVADAGVKSRLGGFRWLVGLPTQFTAWEEYRGATSAAVYNWEAQATHPTEIARAV